MRIAGALRRISSIFVMLVVAGCASNGSFNTAPPQPPPDPHTQMAALETRIFEIVQEERRKIDPAAKPLALDYELQGVARQRSQDMATKNYMAHTAPTGETSASIIMDEDAKFQGLLGENIAAQHYLKAYGVDVEVFAHRFVNTWLKSQSHRDNLAYALYNRTGIGAAVNGDTVYVTQLFATDMGLPPPDGPPTPKDAPPVLLHPPAKR
jgi:uncharacterized protein YkwD